MASYKPTKSMQAAAIRALKWRKEYNRGGTAVGVTRANQLKNREPLSESTVKRMFSFFSRHSSNDHLFSKKEKDGGPTAWRIAWDLWGSNEGFAWSRRIANQLKDERAIAITGPMKKALQNKADEHNEKYGDDPKRKTNVRTLSAVFRRGVGAYKTNPGSVRPNVNSPEQWALARVNSFLYALRNLKFRSGKHDLDLLPSAHPLSSKENSDRIAHMDIESRHIKDIRETEDSVIVEFGKSESQDDEMMENSYHEEDERGEEVEETRDADLPEDLETKEETTDEERSEETPDPIPLDPATRFYTEKVERYFEFDRTKIDEESRTVHIGVSSEQPVERSFGLEVLDHNRTSINMEFMRSGRAPLLLDHDPKRQIGVVESFDIDDENKRTVAKVRFSKSKDAQEIFEDVRDAIRQNISIGYTVDKMEKDGDRDGMPVYRVLGWTPLEISSVSIPADSSAQVGFARSKEIEKIDINPTLKQETIMENVENKTPEISVEELRGDFAKEAKAIMDLAKLHNQTDLGTEAVANGQTLDGFRSKLLEKIASQPLDLPSNVEMNQKEQREYSLVRAVRAAQSGNWKDAGFEKEISDEIALRSGKEARGFYMPTSFGFEKRDQVVGTNSSGGFLKPTDHLADNFIEALYARLVVGRAGAQVLNNLKGDVNIPKMSASIDNASFVSENSAPSESAATFAQVSMSPKTLGAYVDVSRKLMMQSSPSVEALLRNDIINSFARKIDEVALEGGSSNEPSGVIAGATGNVVSLGTNGAAISYAKIVDLVKEVENDNAILNDGSVYFVTNPKVVGSLRQTAKQSSGVEGNFILGDNNRILGAEVLSTTLCPSDLSKGTGSNLSAMIYGDFSQLMLGFFSGVDILVDPYTGSSAATTRIAAFQDCDAALRNSDSFGVIKDIIAS